MLDRGGLYRFFSLDQTPLPTFYCCTSTWTRGMFQVVNSNPACKICDPPDSGTRAAATELKGNYRWINRSQEFRDSFGCARLLLKDRSLGRRSKTRRVFSNGNDALGNGVFKIIWSRTPLWLPCGVVYLRCIPTGGIESNVISSTEVRYTGRRKPTVDK